MQPLTDSITKTEFWGPIGRFERIVTTIALFFSTGAILPLIHGITHSSGHMTADTDPMQQVVWGLMYAIVVAFMSRSPAIYFRAIRQNLLLVGITFWALLSTTWSVEPEYTFMRSLAMFGTMLFAIYLGTRYTSSQLLHMLSVSYFFICILSFVAVALVPQYALDQGSHAGAWQGVMQHKNILGGMCALGTLINFICVRDSKIMPSQAMFYQLCLVLTVACTLLSESKTALGLLLLGFACYVPAKMLAKHRIMFSVCIMALLIVITVMWTTGIIDAIFESVLVDMDRDITLTGRTVIWDNLFIAMPSHLWLGYGQGAFWVSGQGALGMLWQNTGRWIPPHAHNGFLETWVGLGTVGLAWLIILYIRALLGAVRTVSNENAASLFPIIFLVFLLTTNMTEISIVRHNNILWVLFMVVVIQMRSILAARPKPESTSTSLAISIRENVARQRELAANS